MGPGVTELPGDATLMVMLMARGHSPDGPRSGCDESFQHWLKGHLLRPRPPSNTAATFPQWHPGLTHLVFSFLCSAHYHLTFCMVYVLIVCLEAPRWWGSVPFAPRPPAPLTGAPSLTEQIELESGSHPEPTACGIWALFQGRPSASQTLICPTHAVRSTGDGRPGTRGPRARVRKVRAGE